MCQYCLWWSLPSSKFLQLTACTRVYAVFFMEVFLTFGTFHVNFFFELPILEGCFNMDCLSQEIFRETNSWSLVIATCYQMRMVCSIVLYFKYPLIFHAPTVLGDKTLRCHSTYLLFGHIWKLFLYCLSSLSLWLHIRSF